MNIRVTEQSNGQGELFTLEDYRECVPHKYNYRHFDNPRNDNEKLFNLQYELLHDKRESALWEMWEIVSEVADRIIKKEVGRRHLNYCSDEIEDKKSSTCEYLLRRYKTWLHYEVKDNFILAIKDSIRHALDYQTTLEKKTSFIDENCNYATYDEYDFLDEETKAEGFELKNG